jgi:hypothetical protein
MKKFLKWFLFLFLFILIAAIVLPFAFKGKILQIAKEQANNNINAKVNFSNDIGLSIIKSFPNFTLEIKDLSVVGINEFEGDTLFASKEISATLDIMSVISGDKIKIRSILLNQARVNGIVLKDGKNNWDIAKASADSAQTQAPASESKFNISLKKFEIRNSYIKYDDKQGNMSSELVNLNYTLTGDFNQDLFLMKNLLSIDQMSVSYGGIKYFNKVAAKGNAEIDANMKDMLFTFKNNEFGLNDLALGMDGTFQMKGDDMIMDIKYAAKRNDFKDFLSLIPAIYASNFKDLQSKGKLAFDGFVKGTFNDKSMPAFALNVSVDNGWFKYPALPAPVENVGMALHVTNPDGNLDNTKIDLSKLHFELQGDPFDAKLLATNPIKDPYIDAAMKGRLNLDNVVKIVAMSEGTKLGGIITSDFAAKGKVSAIEKKQYENFDASGTIQATNVNYVSKELPLGMQMKNAVLTFNPKTVALNGFDAVIGNSDMQMNGSLTNFFPYFFGKGTLQAALDFKSNMMDANQFLSKDEKAAETASNDTAGMAVVEIPANIDFTLTSSINKLLYTNMEITNFKGMVKVAEQKLNFNNVSLNTLGSSMKLDGFYETTNPKKPTVDMKFGIQNLDIQKAFVTFNTIKKIAPIAEKMQGIFSTTFNMKTALNSKMKPVYEDLFADGVLQVSQASVSDVGVFNKIADVLKKDDLRKFEMKDVAIKYEVKNGRVYTKPFDIKVAGKTMNLAGSTGLDQSIDYTGTTQVALKELGSANTALNSVLAQLNQKAGSNIKMAENINVGLKIGGTFTSPTVSTNLADIAKTQANSLQGQASDFAKQKAKELEAQARAEAEKLKKEAEDKLRSEADRLKKEAESKAKSEVDNLKKKAEEEAKKRLKGLFGN